MLVTNKTAAGPDRKAVRRLRAAATQGSGVARSRTSRSGGGAGGPRLVIRAEDGPADFGHEVLVVVNVERIAEVVLAQWSVDSDLVTRGVGPEVGVGDVYSVEGTAVNRDRELGTRNCECHDAADRADGAVDRDEHDCLAALVLEQLAGEQAAAGAGAGQVLGGDNAVELAERASPPAKRIPAVDDLTDPDRCPLGNGAVLDYWSVIWPLEEIAQGLNGSLGLLEAVLQAGQVRANEVISCCDALGCQHGLHICDGHVEVAQPADHLRGGDLVEGVVAVAGALIHIGRLEQARLVVVPERLHAYVGHAGKLADGQTGSHVSSVNPPPAGGSSPVLVLDSPARGGPSLGGAAALAGSSEREMRMSTTDLTSHLPAVVAAYIAAVNDFDTDALMATFSSDALVNDAHREFRGLASIRAWAEREIAGDKVTMDVTEVFAHHGQTIVRARYDGEYDKTNLPDELILTSYITVQEGRITTLIIVRNTPALY